MSKNGNLLLNVGPRSDGTIPEEEQQILREVGSWLKLNGEAIYGTRPWKVYGEGPTKVVAGAFRDTDTAPFTADDFRFTEKDGVLYAIELGWPASHEAVVHAFTLENIGAGKTIQSIQMLGVAGNLPFERRADGLHIRLPEQPVGKYAYCLRVDVTAAH